MSRRQQQLLPQVVMTREMLSEFLGLTDDQAAKLAQLMKWSEAQFTVVENRGES